MLHKILFAFLLLFPVALQAQKSATVYGSVIDIEGKAVEDAGVQVQGSDKGTFTGADGSYRLIVNSGEKITLIFSYLGASSVVKTIEPLKPGEKFKLNVSIDYKAIEIKPTEFEYRVDRDKPSTVTLNPKYNKVLPNVSGNFEAILRTLPGVSGNSELSSAYNVRGGNFDENLVYVNDIEIYRPQLVRTGQQEGLSFINGDLVSNIRFSAGGFEARYGDKMSSVLDVQYRKPTKAAGGASLNFMGVNAYAEGRSRGSRFTWLLGARVRSNQYILNSLDVQGNYKPLFVDIQTLLTYSITSKLTFSYLANYGLNRYLLIPQTQRTSFGTVTNALQLTVFFDGIELMRYSTIMNGATFNYQPTKRTNLKLIGSYFNSTEKEFFTVEGAYRLDQLDNELGSDQFGQARFNRGAGYFINHARNELNAQVLSVAHKGNYIGKNSTLYWGVQFQKEVIADRQREWYYIDSAGYSIPFNSGDSLGLFSFVTGRANLNSERYMAYIQHSVTLDDTSNLRLTYGLRSNYWSLNQQNVISPRVQLSFEPNRRYNLNVKEDSLRRRDWLLRFAFGYYYQPPFYRELRDLQGQVHTDVKAQRSIHFVFGGDMNFRAWGRPFKFYSEIYYKKLDNLIPYQIENVRIRYYAQNSSNGRAYGWDARVNGEFIKDLESWFSLSIMSIKERITYTDAQGVTKESALLRRPTDQRVNASVFFQDELDRWPRYKMYLNLVYGSNLPFYLGGDNRYRKGFTIPAYKRVDIGFSRDIIAETDVKNTRFKRAFNSLAARVEIFNLTQANNTISYLWVRDVEGTTFGVPNYLTSRRINLSVIMTF